MPKECICLKVRKIYGAKAIAVANKLKIVDSEFEIQRNENFIYIPIVQQPKADDLKTLKEQLPSSEILTRVFQERKERVKNLIDLLEGKLPPHLLASLPHAMDFVGDIGIVDIPPELGPYKSMIGEAILQTHRNVRTVLAKAGAVSGAYRLREFSVIAGESKTETVHKEYGCVYHLDVAKVYFSPRLSYEHNRIASLVKEGETVVDMFAGVGPFAILIAKTHENVKVYAVDINPDAIEFLKKNVRLNKVDNKVHPMLGDARQIVKERILNLADRVIMNLPEKALEFVDVACRALKSTGGTVHFYSFINASDSPENMVQRFTEAVEKSGRKVEKIPFSRSVRATAPYEWQAVLDAKII